jgi:CRISPR-associated endonuclease/helicase Cas3
MHPAIWAKSKKGDPNLFHPLICHMTDVAEVAFKIWATVLCRSCRKWICDVFALHDEDMRRWIAFWVGLHDLGKASPGFQSKRPQAQVELAMAGYDFPAGMDAAHGQVTAAVLPMLLATSAKWPAINLPLARCVAVAVGGHHGYFSSPEQQDLGEASLGNSAWRRARSEFAVALSGITGVANIPRPAMLDQGNGAAFMFLAGLTSVADWIGSNEEFFPPAGKVDDIAAYSILVKERAQRALDHLGWTAWDVGEFGPRSFIQLFHHIKTPRPLQAVAQRESIALHGPGLALIEAPMGEGKTEAALYLADYWTHALGQRGIYIALPTQATSNQMLDRAIDFLEHRYPNARINLHLLHGHSALSRHYENLKLAAVHDDDASPGKVVAETWFAQDKKRSLLAPFGVGTVDQAMLAALQTKHMFVRLFGLAGKTVILDEIHAYDTYMSTIVERLIAWLAALHCSIVLLSATLPTAKRRRLIEAYAGASVELGGVAYPRMTIVQDRQARTVPVPASNRGMTIRIARKEQNTFPDDLLAMLADGGCVAVIRNTVGAAQETFRLLRERLGTQGIEIELFHARFPFGQRDTIERRVLGRYGRSAQGSRPHAAILVATQVIEQSLDLDFDLMITDHAPIDLLLQRVGRLHRHCRTRPTSLRQPQLWFLKTKLDEYGVPAFGHSEAVYDRNVLLRSYLALAGKTELRLPDDLEPLVEEVYDERPRPGPDAAWQRALAESDEQLRNSSRDAELRARWLLIPSPHANDDVLTSASAQLEEDDPEAHLSIQAATRLTKPSVTLICLYKINGKLYLQPDGIDSIDLNDSPSLADAKQLLRNSVQLSHPACVRYFIAQPAPAAWRESGLLRFHRTLELADGETRFGDFVIRLDTDMGIVIDRQAGKETSHD